MNTSSEHQTGFLLKPVNAAKLRQGAHPLSVGQKRNETEAPSLKQDVAAEQEETIRVSEEEAELIANRIEHKLRCQRYEAAKVEIRKDGTVVTTAEDGSSAEIRPNGTIIAFFRDGSVKFFRTGCWSG